MVHPWHSVCIVSRENACLCAVLPPAMDEAQCHSHSWCMPARRLRSQQSGGAGTLVCSYEGWTEMGARTSIVCSRLCHLHIWRSICARYSCTGGILLRCCCCGCCCGCSQLCHPSLPRLCLTKAMTSSQLPLYVIAPLAKNSLTHFYKEQEDCDQGCMQDPADHRHEHSTEKRRAVSSFIDTLPRLLLILQVMNLDQLVPPGRSPGL